MPKTATTTFQAEVFPYIARHSSFQYGGLLQPEGKVRQPALISQLHRYFSYGDGEDSLRQLVQERLSDGPLIISHESILSSSVGASWHERVDRVGRLMKEFDPVVYLTVRHPLDAMHSYFVEHYLDTPSGKRSNFRAAFWNDVRLQIYRYASSLPEIEKAFGTRPIVETMKEIVSGQSKFLKQLNDGEDYLHPKMRQHNVKKRSEGHTQFDDVTLRDRLRMLVYATPVGDSAGARRIIGGLARRLPMLDRISAGSVTVPALKESEKSQFLEELSVDIEYISRNFGIEFGGTS